MTWVTAEVRLVQRPWYVCIVSKRRAIMFSCRRQSELLHNLSPPHLSCCLPPTPTTLPPSPPSLSLLHHLPPLWLVSTPPTFTPFLWSPPPPLLRPALHCHTRPFVVLPPCLVVWWPGTGTVQGIPLDTTMRERFGTCCSSSNLGSPRNSTTSRWVPVPVPVPVLVPVLVQPVSSCNCGNF